MNSIRQFAEEVTPLYQHHGWLGLDKLDFNEAAGVVERMANSLYDHVMEEFAGGDIPAFASTGRVIVHYQPYSAEPNEITIGLNLSTHIEDNGHYYDVFDERFGDDE